MNEPASGFDDKDDLPRGQFGSDKDNPQLMTASAGINPLARKPSPKTRGAGVVAASGPEPVARPETLGLLVSRLSSERDALAILDTIISGLGGLAKADFVPCDTRFNLISEFDGDVAAIVDFLVGRPGFANGEAQVRSVPTVIRVRDAYGALLDAYQRCAEVCGRSAEFVGWLPACHLRLVGVAGERIKWERVAGGPAHPSLWPWIGNAFLASVGSGEDALHPARAVTGTAEDPIRRGFLRAVALSSAGFDQLHPSLFRPLGRLVDLCLPVVSLENRPLADAIRVLGSDLSTAPRRVMRVGDAERDGWFFSTRFAAQTLNVFAERLRHGVVPKELEKLDVSRSLLLTAVQHLHRQWSGVSPTRRHRRHPVSGPLSVAVGIDEVWRLFDGGYVPDAPGCSFSDVSRGGVGATLPASMAESLPMGELVAVKPRDGGAWHVGLVRRIWQENEHDTRVGMHTLSMAPRPARVDDGSRSTDILLCEAVQKGEALKFIVRNDLLRFGGPLFLTHDGTVHKLRPLEIGATGEGFELWVCQVL